MNLVKIKYYSAFLFAFLLPIKFSISNFFLILFFVSSVLEIALNWKLKMTYKTLWFSTIIIFIPLCIGLIYTSYFSIGVNHIGQSSSFLILPLVFSFSKPQDIKTIYSFVKKGLVLGVTFSLIILISYILYNFFILNQEKVFLDLFNFDYTRANFTRLLKIHPTYLGVYIVFSTVLVINRLFQYKRKVFLHVLVLLLFFIGILFVNSRIIFLIYLMIVLMSLFFVLRRLFLKKSYLTFSVFVFLLASLFVFSFIHIKKTYIYYRFTKELQWEFSNDINSFYTDKKESISDPRLARYNAIIELIKEKPIFGYGSGSEKRVLTKMYQSKNMITSYNNKYDAHNQYLSYLVETGMFGLLFYLFFLGSNFYFAFKFKDLEFLSLIIIVSIVCLVENFLNRNAGVTFFAFLSTLFLFKNLNESKKIK